MSATKSQIGHPQGASGAAGLGAALCAMNENVIPPTINLDEPDPACDLDYVANHAREASVRVALCNCIGFGSKNSALVIEKFRLRSRFRVKKRPEPQLDPKLCFIVSVAQLRVSTLIQVTIRPKV